MVPTRSDNEALPNFPLEQHGTTLEVWYPRLHFLLLRHFERVDHKHHFIHIGRNDGPLRYLLWVFKMNKLILDIPAWDSFFTGVLLFLGLSNISTCILHYRLKIKDSGKFIVQLLVSIRECSCGHHRAQIQPSSTSSSSDCRFRLQSL